MGGVYAIPAIFMDVRGAFTNTVPIDAYRGAGKPEANYLIERLIDIAARRLGIDPAELRRRNMIAAIPLSQRARHDDRFGRFAANLDERRGAVPTVRASRRGAPSAQRAAGCAGSAIACFLETSRGAPQRRRRGALRRGRHGVAVLGTQSNGQGHETSYPQIAADCWACRSTTFRLVQADTRPVGRGAGHGGARSMHHGRRGAGQGDRPGDRQGPRASPPHLLQAEPPISCLPRAGSRSRRSGARST